MSTDADDTGKAPLLAGPIAGVVAWLLGYVLVFLVAAPEIDDSPIQDLIEALQGDPATYEMVGWVFYNTHLVETVFQGLPVLGDVTRNFLGGDGLSQLLYLVPAGLLVAAGLAVGRVQGADEPADGVLAGVSVVPGYLLCSIAGVFLFEITVGDVSVGPALLPAILLAGALYPAFFGGLGGTLAALTTSEP